MNLDLRKSIYELTEAYPQLIDQLVALGFDQVTNPIVRKTVGKAMTLEKGCRMKGISLEDVQSKLEAWGYRIIK